MAKKLGLRAQFAIAVFLSIAFATVVICATMFHYSRSRTLEGFVQSSKAMVEASALAFSEAIEANDDVLLDALVHELKSRGELHVKSAFVVLPDGRVKAHSDGAEYGKTYPLPPILAAAGPASLSEVSPDTAGRGFTVSGLLQFKGFPIGALVVSFSTAHIFAQAISELIWIIVMTVPVLVISGLGVLAYGRRVVARLEVLRTRAEDFGQGRWGEPIEVSGDDEISSLTEAFNHMRSDIAHLRERDADSAEKITALNAELTDRLERIKALKEQLAEENLALRSELKELAAPGEIIGANGALRELLGQARQVASLPVTVLITGESGTGKELVARYLHDTGLRAEQPFIAVNCAALPANLIENELFGHEKGAFTGADSMARGKFELAHGGTIFLDEVGELPLEAQSKLLRVLQTGEVVRIGGGEHIPVDVRVVAATNKELFDEVRAKTFREDLYYRLKVVELRCPPLRERIEDLPALVQHFIELYSRKLGREVVGVSPSALDGLKTQKWPGNIRELENLTARAVALAESKVLGPDDFGLGGARPSATIRGGEAGEGAAGELERLLEITGVPGTELPADGWDRVIDRCEEILLKTALERTESQKEAAEALGITTTRMHRLRKKHQIEES